PLIERHAPGWMGEIVAAPHRGWAIRTFHEDRVALRAGNSEIVDDVINTAEERDRASRAPNHIATLQHKHEGHTHSQKSSERKPLQVEDNQVRANHQSSVDCDNTKRQMHGSSPRSRGQVTRRLNG